MLINLDIFCPPEMDCRGRLTLGGSQFPSEGVAEGDLSKGDTLLFFL